MADERIPRAAADGFERSAADYEASRPSYPPDAVARIVAEGGLGPGRRVLDLAAGTGKLTRLLSATGADVVAVEPVAAMRDVLAELTGVEVHDGTAEAIPLADASVDVVTVAQAFHWFAPAPALAEIARVLRSDGTLALVWNLRDRSVDWVREWGNLLVHGDAPRPYDDYYDTDHAAVVAEDGDGRFTPLRSWSTRWYQPTTPELLVQRAASVSVVGALGSADRDLVLERIRKLARTHPDLAGREAFPFPYETRVLTCRRR